METPGAPHCGPSGVRHAARRRIARAIIVGMIVIGLAGFLADRVMMAAFRLLTKNRPLFT